MTDLEGMADAAAAWGWQPVEGDPLDSSLIDRVHDVARTLHDVPARTSVGFGTGSPQLGRTFFQDSYRGIVDGRTVTVTDARINIEAVRALGFRTVSNAVCCVELSTILQVVLIEPRSRFKTAHGAELRTGNPAFDDAYRVIGLPDGVKTLTTTMQQLISARSDWAFVAEGANLVSICREPFTTADDVSRRVSEVLGIVAAIPADVAPAQVDHSVDDLIARFNRVRRHRRSHGLSAEPHRR